MMIGANVLGEGERRLLLALAREAIAAKLGGLSPSTREPDAVPEALVHPAGCFVTLHEGGELRGCIGSIIPVLPLYLAVTESAINAAFSDPRFPPLTLPELDRVSLEISVLGPIEVVTNVESILPGRDGLIIRAGRRAGLLLPQVATEYGWDRETFLDQTCVKAGLPPGTWRTPAGTIEKFTADVFGETTEK